MKQKLNCLNEPMKLIGSVEKDGMIARLYVKSPHWAYTTFVSILMPNGNEIDTSPTTDNNVYGVNDGVPGWCYQAAKEISINKDGNIQLKGGRKNRQHWILNWDGEYL